jgi:hypothetical protein
MGQNGHVPHAIIWYHMHASVRMGETIGLYAVQNLAMPPSNVRQQIDVLEGFRVIGTVLYM